jgi:D-threo-aldose 1-dehydrogenase
MNKITLRNTPLVTTPLGLGCVNLTMHDDPVKAVALLDEAFNLGITHYDVARLYGFGQAEGILGKFLQGKRDRVTVTTKFGLQPPPGLAKRKGLVSFARKMSHRFKFVSQLVRWTFRGGLPAGNYSPHDAAASLETSLRELKTDYVDLFELHECEVKDARNDDLIAYLEGEVTRGRIRCFGIGSMAARLGDDADQFDKRYSVLQFDSYLGSQHLEMMKNIAGRGVITFQVMHYAKAVAAAARADGTLLARWRDRLGVDVTDESVVRGMMLRHAVFLNPAGIALFATTKTENLRANIRRFSEGPPSSELMTAFGQFAVEAIAAVPQV